MPRSLAKVDTLQYKQIFNLQNRSTNKGLTGYSLSKINIKIADDFNVCSGEANGSKSRTE
ncbi:hypothetical protein TUM4433_05850 [Shewanella schlegeliana]|nr:hypothetical protein TUM4433_05850 [Shewanella schlegeliana]